MIQNKVKRFFPTSMRIVEINLVMMASSATFMIDDDFYPNVFTFNGNMKDSIEVMIRTLRYYRRNSSLLNNIVFLPPPIFSDNGYLCICSKCLDVTSGYDILLEVSNKYVDNLDAIIEFIPLVPMRIAFVIDRSSIRTIVNLVVSRCVCGHPSFGRTCTLYTTTIMKDEDWSFNGR